MATFPLTRIFVGAEEDDDSPTANLILPFEIGALLYTEGFWSYCKEHVSARDRYVFNGPSESGRIEPDELGAFITAVHDWCIRYEGDGKVSGVYSGTQESPRGRAEQPKSAVREMLLKIEQLARQAKEQSTFLFVVT
jgi:hypothetical protein